MKLELQTPHIIRIAYRQEPGDYRYGSCLWANFDFDQDNGILSVLSDCGNYAYRWPETGNRFLQLMAGKLGRNVTKRELVYVQRIARIYVEHIMPKLPEIVRKGGVIQ